MTARADRRAARFGLNLYLNPITRDLTCGQLAEITHAYVQSQTADGKRQRALNAEFRKGFAAGRPNPPTPATESLAVFGPLR